MENRGFKKILPTKKPPVGVLRAKRDVGGDYFKMKRGKSLRSYTYPLFNQFVVRRGILLSHL